MNSPTPSLICAAVLVAFSLPAAAGFLGPSIAVLKGDALQAKLQSQPVVMSVTGGMLEVRSKSAAIGGFLVGFIASSALASGGSMPSRTNP